MTAENQAPDDETLRVIGLCFGIGSDACTLSVILTNIGNVQRRAMCLSAIEQEFFTVEVPDEDCPEGDPVDECLLNWGHTPDEYVDQFRTVLNARAVPTHWREKLLETIEAAKNGLCWYRAEFADADSGADDEMMDSIEECISLLVAYPADAIPASEGGPDLRAAAQTALATLDRLSKLVRDRGVIDNLRAALAAQPAAVKPGLTTEGGPAAIWHNAALGDFATRNPGDEPGWVEYRAALAAQPAPKLDDSEQYRMQMAGISTAALGYWTEADTIHPDYDTVPLRDVAKLYAKYDALYKARVEAQANPPQPAANPDVQPKGMPAEWLDAFEEWRQTLGAADLDGKRDLVWRHIAGTGFQAGAAWARSQAPAPAPALSEEQIEEAADNLPCPGCHGTGTEMGWSDASPDAHQVEHDCSMCAGKCSYGAALRTTFQDLKNERERSKKHTDELHWLKSGPFFGLRADKSIQTVADRLDELADACGKYDPRSERASDIRAAATAWRKHLAGPSSPSPAVGAETTGWVCKQCGIDRCKAACPLGHSAALTEQCPMVGVAQAHVPVHSTGGANG